MDEELIRKAIEKHIEFWKLSNKEPLLARIPFSGFKKKPYPVKGGKELVDPERIFPGDIDVSRLVGAEISNPEPFNGDMANFAGCLYPEAWMESIIGCPIYASAFSCSAKPIPGDIEKAMEEFTVEGALKSEWFEVINDVMRKLNEKAGFDIAVRQLHFRGIIDMLAAFMSEEKLCLSIYDYPEKVAELADKFTELYILTVQRNIDMRQQWKGGYISVWGVFAPEPVLDYQIDASSLFSLNTYREHFLKFDKKIIDRFPYSVMHMHACGLHILDAVLEIENLKAVEITLERETGVFKKEMILESCKKIQAASKSVIINGELSEEELNEFVEKLKPEGLAIFYWKPI
ncbi:MAG TPA: hypothetical protein GXX20_07900 [Clostridiaceae bacterium]|nr:hypothetical protein [Clostridiaceae bacterium]